MENFNCLNANPRPIIYIHHEKALGGAPLSLLYLLRCLNRQKYSPHLICLREGLAAEMFRQEGLPVQIVAGPDLSHTELVWFRWWQWPKLFLRVIQSMPLFFRLKKAMRAISPDPIIHLNSSTLCVAAMAAKSLSLPVVWHIREPLARGYFGIRRAILRCLIRNRADQIVAISEHDAQQLGAIPPEKLSVIHNFVDFTQFDAAQHSGKIRKELEIKKDDALIAFLGGDTRVKGVEVYLQAARKVLEKNKSVHFIVAGEMVDELLGVNDLREKLHILGARRDVPALLADSTLLVFPSLVPHFARPVIEAAAMGKPVVASNLGGVRELVVPGETGILTPAGDAEALADAILGLLKNPDQAYRLGQEGLRIAHEKFDARKNAARTFEVYGKLTVDRDR